MKAGKREEVTGNKAEAFRKTVAERMMKQCVPEGGVKVVVENGAGALSSKRVVERVHEKVHAKKAVQA